MCGRYALTATPAQLIEFFELAAFKGEFAPRYNIAPQSEVPVVFNHRAAGRVGRLARWGLIPHWAKDAAIGHKLINARAESVAEKPAFRTAFRRNRCLIPASGFYEWQATPRGRQPFYFHPAEAGLMAFAGLLEHWRSADEDIVSCAIITTAANALARPIHERMPVILAPADYARWLAPDTPLEDAQRLLAPCAEDALKLHPVAKRVGNAAIDTPELIAPITLTESD